jgi:hypothetical protein
LAPFPSQTHEHYIFTRHTAHIWVLKKIEDLVSA